MFYDFNSIGSNPAMCAVSIALMMPLLFKSRTGRLSCAAIGSAVVVQIVVVIE